jgi:hypothetical protein
VTQRRVYTGSHPTVFLTGGVGQLNPKQEFDVEDEHLEAFDARSDIRRVRAPKRGGRKTGGAGGGNAGGSSSDEAASAAPDSGE